MRTWNWRGMIPLLVALTTGGRAGAAVSDADLRVLFHADMDGRLASPRCEKPGAPPADYAAMVEVIARERADATAASRAGPIVLLGGNQVGPALFNRTFLDAAGARGMDAVAALLAHGGYDAVALGHHELSLPRESLDQLLRALAARKLPVVATNVRCDPRKRGACGLLRSDMMLERDGMRVGVLATISPAVLPLIPPGARDGIDIGDPAEAIRAGVRRLRARGATRILVMTQGPRDRDSLDRSDALARAVGGDGAAAPDLILAGGAFDEDSGRSLRLHQRDGSPPVVGGTAGTAGMTAVVLPRPGVPDGDLAVASDATPRVSADVIATTDGARDPDTAMALRGPIAAFCAGYGAALSPGPAGDPLTRDAFTQYVLAIMRWRTGAEIAIINRGAVRRAPFPVIGALTRADVHDALPYAAVIGTARTTGPTVEGVLGGALSNPRTVALGLRKAQGGLEVNGRPLDKARSYRVATIAFVTDGGDALVPAGALHFTPAPGAPDLREAVEVALQSAAAGGTDTGPRVPWATAPTPSADQRLLLVGLTDLGVDLADTTISNPRSYGDAQLSRNQQTSLKGDATIVLQLRLPRHQNDVRLNAKYGWARNQSATAAPVSGETVDLLTFTSVYTFRGLRAAPSLPRAVVPDPYMRVWLESELTAPAVTATQTRDYHHLLGQATAGALFTLMPSLKARAGGGARRELLATGNAGRWLPVIEAGATLDSTALATLGALAIRGEGLADYAFIDPAGVREHQLRAGAKISIPLLPLLFLTAGADLFAVDRERRGWGVSYDTTLGLRLHLDAAYQRL